MLSKLNLNDNDISVIPRGIGGVGLELSYFEMRNNKLTVLPAHLSALEGLKVIDVGGNQIETVEELTLPSLVELNLSKNAICSLPEHFGSLRCLAVLNLSSNQVGSGCRASFDAVNSIRPRASNLCIDCPL
jgi:Leucine-rich repeat (LRR) protein